MPTDPTGREHLTPVKITDTSATERAGFRKCRRQWFLTTVHRLDPQEGNPNFFLGNLVHKALEVYYKSVQDGHTHDIAVDRALTAYQDKFDADMAEVQSQLGFFWQQAEPAWREVGELGFAMAQNYLDAEEANPIFDEIVSVEVRVRVPIRNPKTRRRIGWLSVQTDLVGRKDGELCTADHKTAAREPSIAHLDIDDQLTAEVFAVLLDGGEFPTRAVYNVLMKRAFGPPKELKPKKDGTRKFSKAKDQATTAALYRETLAEAGLTEDGYEDILSHLQAVEDAGESKLFIRDWSFRSPEQITAFERDLFHEFRDMRRVAAHPEEAYPNPRPEFCRYCPVRAVCTTIQDDGDVEAIIKGGFVVGDPRR